MTCFEDLWVGRKDANKNVQTSNVLKQWSTATKFFWEKWVSLSSPLYCTLIYIKTFVEVDVSWNIHRSLPPERRISSRRGWCEPSSWMESWVARMKQTTWRFNHQKQWIGWHHYDQQSFRILWLVDIDFLGTNSFRRQFFESPHEDRYASETFGPLAAGKSNVIFKFLGLTSRFDTTIFRHFSHRFCFPGDFVPWPSWHPRRSLPLAPQRQV